MKKNVRRGSGKGPNDASPKTPNESREKSKPRRQIKNARGLRDVLGLGEKKSGPSQKDSATRRNKDAESRTDTSRPRKPKSSSPSFDRASGPDRSQVRTPQPNKLSYIMNFQPRGQASEQTPGQSPVRPANSTIVNGGPQVHRPMPSPVETKNDYRWPLKRSEKPEPKTDERASKSSKNGERIEGVVKRHPDGFGFLLPTDSAHPDVYISRQSMTGVMTNDRVEALVYRTRSQGKGKADRMAGEITKVIARSNRKIVGKYLPVDQKYGVILDEGRGWGADLRIASKDSMGAKEGDLVAVEVMQYPSQDQEFTGKVSSLIGRLEDPLNDVIRVIHQAGIPNEFSAKAVAEARTFGGVVTEQETKGREDITALNLITIDGATAKDFDDAVWVEKTGAGFKLVVAIADVSHYVKPGTPLDQEAYERGTSTYFPNFVVPMLPEELSNELCSLKPSVKRLCFVCEMKLNFNGEVEKFRFFEGVMQSKARVTYGEAQDVIDGVEPGRLRPVKDNILLAADLAKILMQKRFREGSLDLEIPETQVVVDTSGETADIIKSERLFAHRLIEELMLVTNICTARFFADYEIPGIYRIHEEPDPDNIMALQRYLWNLGGSRALTGDGLQKKLTKALQEMGDRPESQILNILALRTMRQAQYSEGNVGHFGLGFSHYSHFTSPIRRYPDLIAHRLIKSQIYPRYRMMLMSENELASATTFLSACEQRSVKAERQLISIKKARFIYKFIGEEFDGAISSVTKFGVFVLLRQYDVDGLIKIENLGPDRFEFDHENLRLMGQRTGIRYAIGDAIRVRVMGADPEQGRVDFELAEPIVAPKGSPKDGDLGRRAKGAQDGARKGKGLNTQKRRSAEDDSRSVRKERVSKRRRKN
jgi:ribonuclease R